MDTIINQLIDTPKEVDQRGKTDNQHRERLISLAAGGQMKKYNLKVYTTEQIENMSDEEIE